MERRAGGAHHVERLGEDHARVGEEGDVCARDALVLRPRLHHGGVVDAVDEDLVDPGVADVVAVVLVTRHLVCARIVSRKHSGKAVCHGGRCGEARQCIREREAPGPWIRLA